MKRNAAATNSEPAAPKDLTPAAKKEWKRITSLLRARKSLDALDEAGLHDYLVCWQRLQDCEADIGARGVLVKTYRGSIGFLCSRIAPAHSRYNRKDLSVLITSLLGSQSLSFRLVCLQLGADPGSFVGLTQSGVNLYQIGAARS